MKKVYCKNYKEQIDPAGGFQLIDLKKYELNSHIIKPRIAKKNSRFSYASITCSKSNKRR